MTSAGPARPTEPEDHCPCGGWITCQIKAGRCPKASQEIDEWKARNPRPVEVCDGRAAV